MRRNPQTLMVISVHHNRIGFCFFIGEQPMDWQLAYRASKSPAHAQARVKAWLKFYKPDMVLTEDLAGSQRKGLKAQGLILAIKEAVVEKGVEHRETLRNQPFANKYDQIDYLCERFPQMKAVQPEKRKIYDAEPSYITLFEALAMALQYFEQRQLNIPKPPSDLPT